MSHYEVVSPERAHRELTGCCAVDVREQHEWNGALGRVPGAVHIPRSELGARAGELPRDRALLLVCRSGKRSAAACETLAALGFAPLRNLAGGMIDWNRAALPVERRDPATFGELADGLVAWLAQVTQQGADAARARASQVEAACAAADAGAVARALDAFEASFSRADAPADLDLVVASYRRAAAALAER